MPEAEPHVFDTGHFALEATAPDIIPIIADFLDRKIAAPRLKVAVVGGTGNLGGAVAEEARARGHEVAALNSADLDATDYEAVGKFSPGTTRS